MKDFSELEKILNIKFSNADLLKESLTHRSFLNEKRSSDTPHNERLEFLGDAVLELAITELLFKQFPQKAEGELTALRAALVNSSMLFQVANKLKLGDYLLLSRGESKDEGKGRQFILANTTEAIIGAIYLDKGYDAAAVFIKDYIYSNIDEVLDKKLWRDAKSLFQEKAQEVAAITPVYKVLEEKGPDHKRHFVIGVYLEDELVAKGEGYSKQEAETSAAEKALEQKGWED